MHAVPLIVAMLWGATPPSATTVMVTTAPITEYVASGGNDNNDCQSPGTACLTIQGALSVIPKHIANAVQINVGSGTFGCAAIEDFQFEQGGSLWLQGTLVAATITGNNTGTVSTATDYNLSTNVLATITPSVAPSWTAHALTGFLWRITGGTGNGQIFVIADNTTSSLTLAGQFSGASFGGYVVPDNTSTYEIDDWGTTINTNCTLGAGPGGIAAGGKTEAVGGFIVSGIKSGAWGHADATTLNSYVAPTSGFLVSSFKFNSSVSHAMYAANSDTVQVRWNQFNGITANTALAFQNVLRRVVLSNYFTESSATGQSLTGGYFTGSAQHINSGNVGTNVSVANVTSVVENIVGHTFYRSTFNVFNCGTGASVGACDTCLTASDCNIVGNHYSGTSVATAVIDVGGSEPTGATGVYFIANNDVVSATGSTCAIRVNGPYRGRLLTNTNNGAGNSGASFGQCVTNGAGARYDSPASTVTGTVGDNTLDGVVAITYGNITTNGFYGNPARGSWITTTAFPSVSADPVLVGNGATQLLTMPGGIKSNTNQITSSTQTVQSIPTNGKIAFDGTATGSNPPIGMWWDGTFFHIPGPIAGGTGLVTCNTLGTTYFVSTTGNDSNACTAGGASACLTIQGALNKIAKCIQVAPVTLNIGAGTFSCASAEDFQFDSGGGLWIQGTLSQASLTGSMSGTIASATAFNQTGAVPASVTVTAAGWTVNALQGYFLQITGGPGNGEIIAIQSNTATTLNLGVDWQDRAFGNSYVIPTNSSTFSIVSPASVINTACNLPASPGAFQAGGYTATASAGLVISGIKGGAWAPVNNTTGFLASPNSGLLVTGISFTNSSGAGIIASNSDAVHARWNWFGSALTVDDVNVRKVGQTSLYSNYTTRGSASAYALVGTYGNAEKITLVGNVTNNQPAIGITNFSSVTFPTGGVISEFNWINTGSTAQACLDVNGTNGETFIYGDQCQGGYQFGYYSTTAMAGTGVTRVEYSNVTNSSGQPSPCAILAYGGGTTVGIYGLVGSTGNTWGFCAVDGARILVSTSAPSNAITGSSGAATLDMITAISYANLTTNGFYNDPSRGSYIGLDTATKPTAVAPIFFNSANPQLSLPNPVNIQAGNNILDARTAGACVLGSVVSAINVNGVPTCTPASLNGTSAGQSLFVDCSLGNDSNACTASGASACLTIQGAISKVPQLIKGPTTISVASGTCSAGAYVENFQFAAGASPTNGAYLKIFGQLANSTGLASGSATGTASSAANGDGVLVRSTLTDSTQGWTSGNLRGRFLVITGGPGNGLKQIIEDNTATVITIPNTWSTLPTNSSTYAIQDSATTINGNIALPSNGPSTGNPIANYAAFIFSGINPSSGSNGSSTLDASGTPNPTVWLEGFKFVSPVNIVAAVRNANGVGLIRNQIVSYASANAIYLTGPITRFVSNRNAVTSAANAYYIAGSRSEVSPNGGIGLFADQFFGGGVLGVSTAESGCYVGGAIGIANIHVRSGNATNGIVCYNGNEKENFIQGSIIDSNSSGPGFLIGGQSTAASSAAQGSGVLAVYGVTINNVTGDAFQIGGPQTLAVSACCGVLSGTGNTGYGLHLIQGARVNFDIGSTTITGTAGDTSIDGVRNTSYATITTAGEVTNMLTGSTVAIVPSSNR